MKVKLIAIVLILCAYISAQTGFRPGYLITQNGDTVRGQIFYKKIEDMCKVCTIRIKDSTIDYTPSEISGFRFINGKYFVSKKLEDKTVFLEFLVKGKVNVYFSTDLYSDHYYIEKDSLGLTELPYKEEYKTKDNNEVLIKSKKHFGLLTYYMQDAIGLEPEILSIKTPDEKNLIALAKKYHKTVCNGDNCIVYENTPPGLKVNLEFSAGLENFPGYGNGLNPTCASTNIFAHFWLPAFSEDCFLRTGIRYAWVKLPEDNSLSTSASVFRIPIQLEYVAPTRLIQPKMAIGATLYPTTFGPFNFPVTSAMAGIDIKLSKKYFLSIEYDIDFDSEYFVIKSVGSNALTIGFNVSL
ncbi:MAG: hypothetical protein PHR83_15200 [Paludibacter sp.]|nr:hypothetical protein [Paludibacter sp.]